jgi:hypothetical protein
METDYETTNLPSGRTSFKYLEAHREKQGVGVQLTPVLAMATSDYGRTSAEAICTIQEKGAVTRLTARIVCN